MKLRSEDPIDLIPISDSNLTEEPVDNTYIITTEDYYDIEYQNYVNLEDLFNKIQTWDGSVATSYNSGSGTEEDPYIISDASEFAFFATSIDENGEMKCHKKKYLPNDTTPYEIMSSVDKLIHSL